MFKHNNLRVALQVLKKHDNNLATHLDIQNLKKLIHSNKTKEDNKRDIVLRRSAQAEKFSWTHFFNKHDQNNAKYENHNYYRDLLKYEINVLNRYICNNSYHHNNNQNLVISKHLIMAVGFTKAVILTAIANKGLIELSLLIDGYSVNDIKIQTRAMTGVWIKVTNEEIHRVSEVLNLTTISKASQEMQQEGLAIHIGNYWFLNLVKIRHLVSQTY